MESISMVLTAILQWLPFGEFFVSSPFGIVFGALIIDVLICILFLCSKLLLKEYHHNSMLFLIFVGGNAILEMIGYIITSILYFNALLHDLQEPSMVFMNNYFYSLSIIAYLVFIIYFINFLIRLVHHRKQKSHLMAEETKIN